MALTRRAAAIAGLLLAAQPAWAAADGPPPTLKEIVARYIAWRGGGAFERMHGEHAAGSVQSAGLTGTFETWHAQDQYRTNIELGGVRQLEIETPQGSWATNGSGRLERDGPDAFKYASRDAAEADALEGRNGASSRLVGTQQAEGRAWAVVRVQFGDADTYDDFIDPETGELGLIRIVERGQRREERYSDWRMVDGVRLSFALDVTSEAGAETRMQASLDEVNPTVDQALFRRPAAERHTVFAGGAVTTGWLPFVGEDPNRVYLAVRIDGRPVTALLDSGASPSLIDSSLAASLAHAGVGAIPTAGENGRGAAASLVEGVDLSIGSVTFKGLNVGSFDLKVLRDEIGETWPFIIGDDIFVDTVVDFDFANRRVAFWDPAAFRPPPRAALVNLERDGGERLVPISIEGGAPVLFVVDTGFYPNLRLSPAVTEAQSLLENRPQTTMSLGAIGGTAVGELASLKTVELGGVTLRSVPAIFSDTWPSSSYSNREQGLLGLGLLKRFRVIVDWPNDRMYLIPNPGATETPFEKDRLGLALKAEGGADLVVAVYPNSPAAKAGFQAGDHIVSIDGRPAADAAEPGHRPAGAVMTFAYRRGPGSTPSTKVLTLQDYY